MRQFFSSWQTKDYVTAAIALYGAVLATYTAWTKWRENRASIRVTLQMAIGTVPPAFSGYAIRVGAENHGFRDVHFDAFSGGVQVKGLKKTFLIVKPLGNPLPRTLKHGEDVSVLGELQALNDGIKAEMGPGTYKVRGVMRDALNRVHRSKWNTMEVK